MLHFVVRNVGSKNDLILCTNDATGHDISCQNSTERPVSINSVGLVFDTNYTPISFGPYSADVTQIMDILEKSQPE